MQNLRRISSESRALKDAEIFETLSEKSRVNSLRDELAELKKYQSQKVSELDSFLQISQNLIQSNEELQTKLKSEEDQTHDLKQKIERTTTMTQQQERLIQILQDEVGKAKFRITERMRRQDEKRRIKYDLTSKSHQIERISKNEQNQIDQSFDEQVEDEDENEIEDNLDPEKAKLMNQLEQV
ncbi:MAG: hypothetical protein EZS28_021812 [Streblomastix strix]|uniref:Uncharacterized protein n=1 Tax=Streblomastix strix TaxID=222440 RepID=A0A5J4VJJ2_9EUKA|nr:MAG: hypothetical protein EZS28_021812 [Streblomastix strix]